MRQPISLLSSAFAATLNQVTVPHLAPALLPVYSRVGELLWQALEAGHTALPLPSVAAQIDAELHPKLIQLADSAGVVQTKSALGPILFYAGYWYLQRFANIEARLAAALTALNRDDPNYNNTWASAALATQLKQQLSGEQYRALETALKRQLLILSGGPGTGKTFTISKILEALLSISPTLKVAGCAPTGKAAARLAQGCVGLTWSGTVHALMQQARNQLDKLDFGVIIVDEATMLDAQLADSLLAMIDPNTRLILAGDHHQLSSVLSGALFSQCCELTGATCFIKEARRFTADSGIALLAAHIRQGELPPIEILKLADVSLIDLSPNNRPWFEAVQAGYAALYEAIKTSISDADLIQCLGHFKVLSATHGGPAGVDQTNQFMASVVRAQAHAQGHWYAGRIIMITRNDSTYNLNNGESGVCVVRDGQWAVLFESGATVDTRHLVHVVDGWAVTVHKSQGSEYHQVLVALPEINSPQARRELVYTAITRAKKTVQIAGRWEQLKQAANNPTERFSGLAVRLQALSRP